MTLRARLRSVDDFAALLAQRAALPEVPRMTAAAQAVAEQHALSGGVFEPPDLDRIATRLRDLARRGRTAEMTRRDLKYAPACLWRGEAPLADDEGVLAALLAEIERRARRSLVNVLAAAYLRFFAPGRPGLALVGRTLRRLAPRVGGMAARLDADLNAFDPAEAVRTAVDACAGGNLTPQELLAPYGLTGELARAGFAASVFHHGMARIAGRLQASPKADLVRTAERWAFAEDGPRFEGAATRLARTIVGPFAERDPEESLRRIILDVVLTHLKDPRLHPHLWVQVPDERDVVTRWLTGESLRQFFDIVDRVAKPGHWLYRRAFWNAYHEAGAIEQAWVAFGPQGAREARAAFGKEASFGVLENWGKVVLPNHAVLLMRIGNLTICDWSHDGRCIVWPHEDSEAPRLYRARYVSGQLAPTQAPKGGLQVTHHHSQGYAWQRKIAAFIRQKTGIAISERNFQVKALR